MSDDKNGSQNDDNASKDAQGDNDTSNDAQNASGAAGTSNDTSSGNDKGDTSSNDTVSRADYDKIDARMRAADRRAEEAEQKAKELEREKMSDQEKVASELKDVTTERDNLREELDDVRLENAFLSYNKHTWHDPQDALRLCSMEGVEIKDGKVNGLSEAIDKLAKDKPHLLKKVDDGDGKGSSAASGSASNGTRKGDKKEPPKNYSSRFPALRSSAKKSNS